MLSESPLEVKWEGRKPTDCPRVISSWSIKSNYLTSTDTFEMTVFDSDRRRLRNLGLEPLTLSVHGAQQLIGRVDIQRWNEDGSCTLQGRDFIGELVECNIDPTFKIAETQTLFGAILSACGPCGIDSVVSMSDVAMRNIRTGIGVKGGKNKSFAHFKPGDLRPTPGEGLYEFFNKICARHGATIQPGPTRSTLVLSAPNYSSAPIGTLVRSAARVGNIDSGMPTEDYSSFPTWAWGVGNINQTGESSQSTSAQYPATAFGTPSLSAFLADKIELKRIKPTDPTRKSSLLYRLLYFKDDMARSSASVERSITRTISERLKETLTFPVIVKGFKDIATGAIWSIDTMVNMADDFCFINEPLWIAGREMVFGKEQAETRLELWRPNTFIVT